MSGALAQLDKARQMLVGCRDLPEVKKIRDIAESAKVYAKAANLGREAQNYAAEISILAACKAGEILKQLEKTPKQSAASVAGDSEYRKTLHETGTAERTAQYWQKISEVPEDSRSAYFARVQNADNGEITVAGLLRAVPHAEKRKHRNEPVDDFEEVRRAAIKMLNLGHREMRWVAVRATCRPQIFRCGSNRKEASSTRARVTNDPHGQESTAVTKIPQRPLAHQQTHSPIPFMSNVRQPPATRCGMVYCPTEQEAHGARL